MNDETPISPDLYRLLDAEKDVFQFLVHDYGFARSISGYAFEATVVYVKGRVALSVFLERGSIWEVTLHALKQAGDYRRSFDGPAIDLDSLARLLGHPEPGEHPHIGPTLPERNPRGIFQPYADLLLRYAKEALEGDFRQIHAWVDKYLEMMKREQEERRERKRREREEKRKQKRGRQ